MSYPGDSILGKYQRDSAEQMNAYLAAMYGIQDSARQISNIGEYETGDAATSLWHCTYCGGKRPSATFRCEGCGASR